eukprot:TRINITY_DN47890_c0_g1_i1.p1 TRINITY_DN47890_c0_g1~~TRINITY_DN47890_c0_g1_i1.p1  ORF type:complete len:326 (-),score=36.27 TRINITY_DN47890_c0_g1_i1:194-1171(-)
MSTTAGVKETSRWSRRLRVSQVAKDDSVVEPDDAKDSVGNHVDSDKNPTAGSELERTEDEGTPQNLRALLAYSLESIETGHDGACNSESGVVELGAMMAQQGLFARSKMASAQQLITEHSLTESYNKVLEGGARHLRGVYGDFRDLGLFDALRKELGRGEGAWSRGTQGSARIKWSVPGVNGWGLLDGEIVQDLHGDELPAFSFVLRSLGESVNAEILSWWVNVYEEGSVGLGFHHDHQSNNSGLRWGRIFDATAGASFGACRNLTFRHGKTSREFDFPQANGDIFAFDTQTDLDFLHGIYTKKKKPCGPRISVIIVGKTRVSTA